jgi:hypothetical protein
MFQNIIEGFHCTISLHMIWTTLMVLDHELSSDMCNHGIDKMVTLITRPTPRVEKPSNDMLSDEMSYIVDGTILSGSSFFSSCEIIGCSNNVAHPRVHGWWVNGSYKVNNQFLKWLKCLN